MADKLPKLDLKAKAALLDTIAKFDQRTRAKGSAYFATNRVSPISYEKGIWHAMVSGSFPYGVQWGQEGARWLNFCSCPVEGNCKHAYAMATKLMRLKPEVGASVEMPIKKSAPAKVVGSTITHFTNGLQRPLTEKEEKFVRQLDRVYERIKYRYGESVVSVADLLDLGVWGSVSVSRLRDVVISGWWDSAPGSPLKLWQYIAYFLVSQKRRIPEWLRPLSEIEKTAKEVQQFILRKEVDQWKKNLSQRQPVLAEKRMEGPSLRLRLHKKKFLWEQARDGIHFESVSIEQVKAMVLAPVTVWGELPPSTRALLLVFRLDSSGRYPRVRYTLNLEEESDRGLVNVLLNSSETRSQIIGANGQAVTKSGEVLNWAFEPDTEDPHLYLDACLVKPGGEKCETGLIYLPGTPPLYFDGSIVYEGPTPLNASTVIQPHYRLPIAALAESPDVMVSFKKEGILLPESLLPQIREVALHPQITVNLEPMRNGDRLLVLEVLAQKGRTGSSFRFRNTGWDKLERVWEPDGTLVEYVLQQSDEIADLLGELGLSWHYDRAVWGKIWKAGSEIKFGHWVEKTKAIGVSVLAGPGLADFFRPAQEATPRLRVESHNGSIDWFDVSLDWDLADLELTPEELKLILAAQGQFVELPGRGWKRVVFHLNAEVKTALTDLGLDPNQKETQEKHPYHALQLVGAKLDGVIEERALLHLRERAASIIRPVFSKVPPGFKGTLRPYQEEGLHFLTYLSANNLGGVLADDMGLGKTVQTIAWLLALQKKEPKGFSALIVCPKSVLRNWESELAKFAPRLSVSFLQAGEQKLDKIKGVVITNYAQLRLQADALTKKVWTVTVLDEAQNIKNPQSTTSQTARALQSHHRLALTGTPIENRPLDLWSLFSFAQPGLLGAMAGFKRLYDNPNLENRVQALGRLQKRVRHFMLRRTKSQVTPDLPERIEEDLWVDLEGDQLDLYQAELKLARSLIKGVKTKKDLDKSRLNILQSLLRLRQICCDPRLRTKSQQRSSCAKLDALLEQIEPIIAEGHKILIFSQFVEMLKIISTELKELKVEHVILTGQTENREELVNKFQQDSACQVFLLSLKAGGVGLNLTSASYVFLYDPWWNPAVEAQAIDRAHRIGQHKTVIGYRLVAKNTIEQKIRLLQKQKSEMAQAVVQEESLAKILDLDSLRFLLAEGE